MTDPAAELYLTAAEDIDDEQLARDAKADEISDGIMVDTTVERLVKAVGELSEGSDPQAVDTEAIVKQAAAGTREAMFFVNTVRDAIVDTARMELLGQDPFSVDKAIDLAVVRLNNELGVAEAPAGIRERVRQHILDHHTLTDD